ncbi:hypothetical protein BKA61DRAFT_720762 [Leptodontidium sp. MPI-SDFR-AT-0119]|nr:hypothetical protein BKA61DRAFT_720762 [Leptodontidium sp. MPI-SDFR-AT-0119]
MSSPIKNVIILGASGDIGRAAISALLTGGFKVSTDYSSESLLQAFKGQDAIVSAIATASVQQQISIIDAAIGAGVKRFIPSEYGIDTADPRAADFYLQTKQGTGLSWTAIVVGSIFDWTFQYPGLMGWNLPERKATIFDGGRYENLESTKNEYVYVNSFTVTQGQVLAGFNKLLEQDLEVGAGSAAELGRQALEAIGRGEGRQAHVNAIAAAIYGNWGLNNYSKTRELWNKKLGLPEEKLEDSLVRILAAAEGSK